MNGEPIIIPVVSTVTLQDLAFLERTHAEIGIELWLQGATRRVGYGSEADTDIPVQAHRAVTEMLRLARFALLVREIAECRPGDNVVDVVNQVHNEVRSRP